MLNGELHDPREMKCSPNDDETTNKCGNSSQHTGKGEDFREH